MEKNKIFMYSVIGVLFAAVIAVSVALYFTFNSLKTLADSNQQNIVINDEITVNPKDVTIFSINEPITANLITDKENDEKHLLRISVGLALDSSQKDYKSLNEDLTEKMEIIRHTIISVIRNKTYKEMQDPNIQELMGKEILNELKNKFQTNTIVDIYFGEFFVQ
ncbi:MAG: flagellar basal body-associated FliL family protein [Epulopiscium sp.]|nr:flagellar basal body-associated FliL family protein [Candidatus Epulonipiscium sp.]